jgi:hypothetical protein
MRLVVGDDRQEFRIVERNGELQISLGSVHDGEATMKADTHRRFSLQPEGLEVLASSLEIVEVSRG